MEETKVCSTCRERKSTREFCKNKRKKDGYNNVCKRCTKERDKKTRKWYKNGFLSCGDRVQHLYDITIKVCKECKKEKPVDQFYREKKQEGRNEYYAPKCRDCYAQEARTKRKKKRLAGTCAICGGDSSSYRCQKCSDRINELLRKERYKLKTQCVMNAGGKCEVCGIAGEPEIYDFHHRDSKTKAYNISDLLRNKAVMIDKIRNELAKCALLCRNCHRSLHFKREVIRPKLRWLIELKKMAVHYKGNACSICGNSFPLSVYDFHHMEGESKEHNVSTLLYTAPKWIILKPELDKCILVCANCHQNIHFEDYHKWLEV